MSNSTAEAVVFSVAIAIIMISLCFYSYTRGINEKYKICVEKAASVKDCDNIK